MLVVGVVIARDVHSPYTEGVVKPVGIILVCRAIVRR